MMEEADLHALLRSHQGEIESGGDYVTSLSVATALLQQVQELFLELLVKSTRLNTPKRVWSTARRLEKDIDDFLEVEGTDI